MHSKFASWVTRAILVLLFTLGSIGAWAQNYPSRPVRVIYPNPPGGMDPYYRAVLQQVGEQMGQSFVFDNRPGGNQVIGADLVAKSAADGYTLLVSHDQMIMVPLLQKVPFDVMKDFIPIALLGSVSQALVVPASFPANSLREFIAQAKAKPGTLNYASFGMGGFAHVNVEILRRAVGMDIVHVPYQGGAGMRTALLGEQVQLGMVGPGLVAGDIKMGKMKPLAILTDNPARREPSMPEVPTIAQAGAPNLEMILPWLAIYAPAGTPPEVVQKLNVAVNAALKSPALIERARFDGVMLPSGPNTVEDAAVFVRKEYAFRQRLLQELGPKFFGVQ